MSTAHPQTDTKDLEAKILAWRNDPALYFVERLGITNLADHEKEMLQALPDCMLKRMPLVVPSGHAMGKDFTISGGATLWFAECFGPCKVIMTGPTDRQVKEIMWSELSRAYNNRPIKDAFGRLITCKLDIEEDWFVLAFTTKESAESAGKFQGAHSPRIMVVVSEAQAVDDKIFEQIDGITTSGTVLECYLANPLRTTGQFAKMMDDTTHNKVIHLDCLKSPNYIAKREVVPGLCSYEWVESHRRKWNADGSEKDPRWLARVRGRKPKTSINTVFAADLYDKCVNRQLYGQARRGAIGVDPARFGDDDMVIKVIESGIFIAEKVIPKCDAVTGSAEIIAMQKRFFPDGQISIVIDCDGLGGPYLDFAKNLVDDRLEIAFIEYHGSSNDRNVVDSDYENIRAEAAFFAKNKMDEGLVSLEEDEGQREEAVAIEYFVNGKGRIQIEDKDDLKERIGRSPNKIDAAILAIWGLFKFSPVIKPRDVWATKRSSSMVPNFGSAMSV